MKSRIKPVYVLIILLIGVILYRRRSAVQSIAAVFALSGVLTLMLAPVCRMLERRGIRTSWSAGITVGGFLLMALMVVSAFVPYLVTRTVEFVTRNAPTFMQALERTSGRLERIGLLSTHGSGIGDMIATAATGVTSLAARGGMTLAAQAGRVLFALVLSYYLLCERERLGKHLLLFVPPGRRLEVIMALRGSQSAATGYLAGMVKTSAFVGVTTYLGLLLLRIPDALLLSLFMAILEILPYIGPVLAAVPILLSSLPLGWNRAVLALALVILVQQIEGNFVTPHVTAASTSIQPLAALISVFVLGSMLGIWGVLFAVPLAAAARSLAESVWQARSRPVLAG